MSVNHKIVFTFNTSEDKKFSMTLPNVDENFESSEAIAVGEAIKTSNVILPKEGTLTSVNNIRYVKTDTTTHTFNPDGSFK